MSDSWLLPEDIAAIVGVTPRTIQRWCNEQRIPHWRLGRLFRFTPAQVEEIAAAYSCVPEDPAARAALVVPNPEFRPNRPVLVDIDSRRRQRPA